jgi:hypothetical protein
MKTRLCGWLLHWAAWETMLKPSILKSFVAVRSMAGRKGQNNHRKELDQSQHTQVESAPGKRIDLPADCDR